VRTGMNRPSREARPQSKKGVFFLVNGRSRECVGPILGEGKERGCVGGKKKKKKQKRKRLREKEGYLFTKPSLRTLKDRLRWGGGGNNDAGSTPPRY